MELWWLSLVWAALSEVTSFSSAEYYIVISGHLRPVHEGQSADDHHYYPGPLRQAQDLAAGQAAQVRGPEGLVHLPPLQLLCPEAKLTAALSISLLKQSCRGPV